MVSPTALFDRNAREHLVPAMADLGFRYSSKERTFLRDRPPFQQIVYFRFLRASREDYCKLDPRIEIRSDDYERWYRETWGEELKLKPHYPDILFSEPAYWVQPWPKRGNFLTRHLPWRLRPGGRTKSFHLTNSARDRREMKEIREAMLGPLMAAFDEVTSWDGVAECSTDLFATMGYACDYYLIGENRAMALKVLEDALAREEEILQMNRGAGTLEDLKLRYEKYFGKNGLFPLIEPKGSAAG